ncbi:MAG TPA: dihydrodipicolinate synthase family protein [Candidatus Baltobacteraceae bacterium]|jgi:4-hydroxy-tetrahydrodipicolinate synthase
MNWSGVFPAITTPFDGQLLVDHSALASHVTWLVDEGCHGIIPLGSLGEASTLSFAEKRDVLQTCVRAVAGRVPIVAGIAALSTAEAIDLARESQRVGCAGLMVLPPYVYRGDERETETHFVALITATSLPCMLYNNPIAYGVDVLPARIVELAKRHSNLRAVKESSGDIRRVAELRRMLGDRIAIFVGLDDLAMEGFDAGAVGWVAGLVNAFPRETVELYTLIGNGDRTAARALYDWFLPLLGLDTKPKFIQLIKLVQAECGRGTTRVRPPRLELTGDELATTLEVIREGLKRRIGAPA